jgi:hypothetical protein
MHHTKTLTTPGDPPSLEGLKVFLYRDAGSRFYASVGRGLVHRDSPVPLNATTLRDAEEEGAHLLAVVRKVAGPPPPSLAVQTAQFRIPSASEREMDALIEGVKSGIMPPEPKTPALSP